MPISRDDYIARCQACALDLYRFAFTAIGDKDIACDLVIRACVAGLDRCLGEQDERELKVELTRLLYRTCRLKLLVSQPVKGACPLWLDAAGRKERLILALRFAAGLRSSEAIRAAGMTPQRFSAILCRGVTKCSKALTAYNAQQEQINENSHTTP